jgi:cysteine desulfurase
MEDRFKVQGKGERRRARYGEGPFKKGSERMAQDNLIYLDHNATTPLAPEAVEAMKPFLKGEFGNPSSGYDLGLRAKEAVERARKEMAGLLWCKVAEILFTSGGTESNNTVLKGVVDFLKPGATHIITSAVEHPAILNPLLYLMELGVQVTILPVDGRGLVDPDDVARAIKPETALISIMLANNETGTLQPIKEISELARRKGVSLHTDAAQAIGKIPVDVNALGVDFLTVAGHKLYAPKGVGALFIRQGKTLTPLMHGAAQEGGRRAGTENIILVVGLGAAARVARERLNHDPEAMAAMRDRLQALLFEEVQDLVLNGHPNARLPNTLNVSVPEVEGSRILDGLPGLMASTGAACHDRSVRLSHVLAAMKIPPRIGMGALRLTVGRSNTMAQMDEAARMIIGRIKELKKESQ